MAYCADHGIPHSEFLEWEAVDRAKALAWMLEKGERCALCGTAPWEWEQDKFAYEPVDHFCKGCYLKHVASEEKRLPGTTIELTRLSPQDKARRKLAEQKKLREARKRD